MCDGMNEVAPAEGCPHGGGREAAGAAEGLILDVCSGERRSGGAAGMQASSEGLREEVEDRPR